MNIKIYNQTKYIATFGALFLFLAPFLAFLDAWKDIFNDNNSALIGTVLSLEFLGLVIVSLYLYLRNRLTKKTKYEHRKKDLRFLLGAYLLYLCGMIFSLVYVILAFSLLNDTKVVMISFAPLYSLEAICLILASIFESMSRIDEQIFLYQEQEKKPNDSSTSKTGVERTKSATDLLAKEQERASETPGVKQKVVIDENLKKQLDEALKKDKQEKNDEKES